MKRREKWRSWWEGLVVERSEELHWEELRRSGNSMQLSCEITFDLCGPLIMNWLVGCFL